MSIIPRPVPVLEQTPSHGWVYIIRADSGHYKIGKSKRPDKRVGEFTLQLPFKGEIVHLIECADYHAAERLFHAMCREHHVNGEWFLLPDTGVNVLKEFGALTTEEVEGLMDEDPNLLPQAFYIAMNGTDAWEAKYGEATQ